MSTSRSSCKLRSLPQARNKLLISPVSQPTICRKGLKQDDLNVQKYLQYPTIQQYNQPHNSKTQILQRVQESRWQYSDFRSPLRPPLPRNSQERRSQRQISPAMSKLSRMLLWRASLPHSSERPPSACVQPAGTGSY